MKLCVTRFSVLNDTMNGYIDTDQDRYVYRDLVANSAANQVIWQNFVDHSDFYFNRFTELFYKLSFMPSSNADILAGG